MLRLLRPALITLTLAVPTASYALGLGDIHILSALHQPLVAQIELVGVVDDELGRVSAALASDELFQKYNLERAPFIYGTTLSVGRDAQGRPVLNMRSKEKFTEPVVTLLVDMHAPSGELIREYTLFLDPAGLTDNTGVGSSSAAAVAASSAQPASNTEAASTERAAQAPSVASAGSKLLGAKYTVARRDTLARIVTATGARSRTERHRMMIAIYRANPAAFQNNLNRMHTGVILTFPTAEQLAAISVDETHREYDRQMAEWRASLHQGSAVAANKTREPSAAGRSNEALPSEHAALNERIASLEESLAHIQQQLKQPVPVQTPVAVGKTSPAPSVAPTPVAAAPAFEEDATSEDDADDAPATKHRGYQLIAIGVGAGLLFFAGAWLYLRRRNSYAYHATPRYPVPVVAEDERSNEAEFSTPPPALPQSATKAADPIEAQQPATTPDPKNAASWFEDSFSTPIADLLNDPTVSLGIEDTAKLPEHQADRALDTEVLVAPELQFAGDTAEQKFAFFNPEATTNTEHVVMGSALTEPKSFVERRRNPADVLRQAIEREPDRSDLRLKLLELYYTAAAENRRAFLEATRQLAKNDTLATQEDWSRIADMGRIIAPDDELFSSGGNHAGDVDDKRVA